MRLIPLLFIPHEIPPHLRAPLNIPMTEKMDNMLDEINKKLDLKKLESQKDIDPLKNKNRTLNTIGRTKSSEDEDSEDNQLTDLTNSSDIDNLESQFTDKLQINKLTLSSSPQDRKKEELRNHTPKRIGILNPLLLIYSLKKDILLLIHLIHQI